MLSICKRFEFCYGHFLPNHEGKCKNQHGHNAILEIEVSNPHQIKFDGPEKGMVIDFGRLKDLVKTEIIEKLDHTNLNAFLDNPTAEIIVIWIRDILSKILVDKLRYNLERVRLYETPDSYAEWRRS